MRKILVTGGTGLIGTHCLPHLTPQDEVYAVSRSGDVPGAKYVLDIDLGQPWSTADLPRGIDCVVHLAQSEHYREFPQQAEDVFAVNTLSTAKLLDYACETGVKNFVLASSAGGLALFARELISLLPDTYAGAAMPLAVLSLGLVMQTTQQVTGVGISLEKKPICLHAYRGQLQQSTLF